MYANTKSFINMTMAKMSCPYQMKSFTDQQWCVYEDTAKYSTSLASTLSLWMKIANIFYPEYLSSTFHVMIFINSFSVV